MSENQDFRVPARIEAIEQRLAALEARLPVGWSFKIPTATGPIQPPTDASLLADLRRVLGEGWTDCNWQGGEWRFEHTKSTNRAVFTLTSLHKLGPAKIAAALKLLAGVE